MPSLSCRSHEENEASGGFSSGTEFLSRRLEGSLAQPLFLPSAGETPAYVPIATIEIFSTQLPAGSR